MKRTIILAAAFTLSLPGLTAEPAGKLLKVANEQKAPLKSANRPVYRPPALKRLQENTRVQSGATRSARAVTDLHVLAPEHTGFTTKAQPVLYWYTSREVTSPVEVVVEVVDGPLAPPIVDKRLSGPFKAGLHALRLADFGVKLEVGQEYAWRVIVVVDESRRSNDVYAGANIARIDEPASLKSSLAAVSAQERPRIYASAGLWFDAFASIEAAGGKSKAECRSLLKGQSLDDVSCPGGR